MAFKNVGAMVQRIKDRVGHDPSMANYDDYLVDLLQEVFDEICEAHDWRWLQKKAPLTVYATIDGSATETIQIAAATGNRELIGTGTTWDTQIEGATFVGPDLTEITVGRRFSATSAFLVDNYASALVAGTTAWSIQFRTYLLPNDCIEVLGYMDRTSSDGGGVLGYVGRDKEEKYFLNRTETGQPRWIVEDDHLTTRPPFKAPTVTLNSTSPNNLVASTVYEYRYTHYYAGRESPPSATSAQITTDAVTNKMVEVSDFEIVTYTGALAAQKDSGKLTRIYRRDVTNNGRWFKVGELESTGITTSSSLFNDSEFLPTIAIDWDHADYWEPSSPRKSIRFYQTPDASRDITLRYVFRPPPLVADAEVPVGETLMSDYLVQMVLSDLLEGESSQKAAIRARQKLSVMLGRGLINKEERFRRTSSFTTDLYSGFFGGEPQNFTNPSIT